ncbi:MAG: CRISPR-associated endonuclease Cas1 [Gammaproteobacteria bacterium]
MSVHSERLTDFDALRWHRIRLVLECVEAPPVTRPGHAMEVANALFKGVHRDQGQRIAYHAIAVPLSRQALHSGTRIPLEAALVGFSDQSASAWLAAFFEHVNGRPESHFQVLQVDGIETLSFENLRLPHPSEEWRLDFLTPLPFARSKDDVRTGIRATTFVGMLRRRMESLFETRLPEIGDADAIDLLPFYWHYEELPHSSRSQNERDRPDGKKRTSGGAPHLQYYNGCTGPLLLRGELAPMAPWLALAQELHAGGMLELNPLGHFRLVDRPEPFLDKKLCDEAALVQGAEMVLSRNDAALVHAKGHGGIVEPKLVAAGLAAEFRDGRYRPEPYEIFEVPKTSGGLRTVERLSPRDLIAQQRLYDLLAAPFDRSFSPASMAFRRGVAREAVCRRIRGLIAAGYRYAVRGDIEDFFPSIEHGRLLASLERRLPRGDLKTRSLLANIIAAPFVRDGETCSREKGLAQGSPLSPLLANVYLDTFDRDLASAGVEFVRYADDFVLLAHSRESARLALERAGSALDALGLKLSPDKTHIGRVAEGFDFLGERFDDRELEEPVERLLAPRRPVVITEPYLMLAVNGDALDVRRSGQLVQTIPFRRISEIVVLGKAVFSTALVQRCAQHGIPMSLALETGYQIGTFTPDSRTFHDRAWRQGQRYHGMSEQERTAIAADFAASKILNYAQLVRGRYRAGDASLVHRLEDQAKAALSAGSNDQIRGHEGQAAREMFAWLNRSIAEKKTFLFSSARRERGAPDRLNSMLNLGYYLLYTRINALIRTAGLNPYWGFLHEAKDDYETLVADVQELFRSHVDRLVLRLINRGEIQADDFEKRDRSFRLARTGIRKYVEGFETLFSEIHGGLTIGDAVALQVHNLREFLSDGKPLRLYRWSGQNKETPTLDDSLPGTQADPGIDSSLTGL